MKHKNNPTAILTADWHIRGDRPICRTDKYMETQKNKIQFILNLANTHNCPILVAGDFGNKPLWGDKLLNWFIDIIDEMETDEKIYIVVGQHDLLNHRLDKWEESGLGVLNKKCEQIEVLSSWEIINKNFVFPFPYGIKFKNANAKEHKKEGKNIALIHKMVIKSQKHKLFPEQKSNSAKWLLKKYPSYSLIVSGDNHQAFVEKYDGRILVNPGSIMRSAVSQIYFKPRVYLWYREDNDVQPVYLPVNKDVMSVEHIKQIKDRYERIHSFVDRLKEDYKVGASFENNMKDFLSIKKNKQHKKVIEKIWKAIENNPSSIDF